MPYNLIKAVVFTAELYDNNSKPSANYTPALQCFDSSSNKWETLVSEMPLKSGVLNYSLTQNAKVVFNANFFKAILSGIIPPTRIINNKTINAKPVELIAEDTRFTYVDKVSSLTISFGANFEIPNTIAAESRLDKEKETFQIFSKFPIIANNAELDALKKELETKNGQLAKLNVAFDKLNNSVAEKDNSIANLQKQLNEKEAAINNALATNRKLEETIKALQNSIAALEKELKSISAELEAKKNEIAKLNEQIAILSKGSGTTNAEKAELLKKMDALNATIKTKQAEFDKLVKIAQENEITLAKMKDQYASLNVEYSALEKAIVAKIEDLKKQNQLIESQSATLKVNETAIAELTSKLKIAEDKLAATPIDKKEYKPAAQSVSTVYSSILNEFQKTNEIAKGNNLRLSNISLNIKTFIEHDDDGIRLQLVDANKINSTNSGALSDIKIEIGNTETSNNNTFTAPDLIGLTETAARRVIDALGLRLKAVYQYVNTEAPVGQSFRQSPAKGTEILPNETITLIFAKENN